MLISSITPMWHSSCTITWLLRGAYMPVSSPHSLNYQHVGPNMLVPFHHTITSVPFRQIKLKLPCFIYHVT